MIVCDSHRLCLRASDVSSSSGDTCFLCEYDGRTCPGRHSRPIFNIISHIQIRLVQPQGLLVLPLDPPVATKTAQPSRLRLATEKQDTNFATEKIKNTRLEKFIITEMAEKYFGPKLRVEGRVVSRWPMGQCSEDWVKNLRGKIFSGNAPGGTS